MDGQVGLKSLHQGELASGCYTESSLRVSRLSLLMLVPGGVFAAAGYARALSGGVSSSGISREWQK